MEDEKIKNQANSQMQVNVDPLRTPILFAEAVRVSSGVSGLVLDIAQGVAGTNQAVVVARIGLSKEHAKKLAELIAQHVAKQGVIVTGDKKIIN